MKKPVFLFLYMTCLLSAAAQQAAIDSLRAELSIAGRDTNQVFLLAELSNQYLYTRPDSALFFAQQGYSLAQQLAFLKGEALCLNRMANPSDITGNPSKALELFQKARALSEKTGDAAGVARTLNNIANLYYDRGDYARALPYLYEAKAIAATLPNPVIYGIVLHNMGESYYYLNRLDSAWMYAQKAHNIVRKYNPEMQLSDLLRVLGNIQAKEGQQARALGYYRASLAYSNQFQNYQPKSKTYLSMAELYAKAQQSDSAIFYARKSLKIAQDGAFIIDILNASRLLTEVFEKRAQTAEAFHYFKIAMAANDSLFSQEKVKRLLTLGFDEKLKAQEIETATARYRDKMKIYSLLGGLALLVLAAVVLLRNSRQKQQAYALLQKQKEETDVQKAKAEQTLEELKATQAQLIQSEKMASLGELTAGVAHEIQNPLNFVNNFSEVNKELLAEMNEEIDKENYDDVKAIAKDVIENQEIITLHGKRADAIVKGMLQHSRANTGKKEPTDINALCDEYLWLSYHGLRAKDKSFNASFETHFDESIGKINVVPQDIGRVLLNLFNNAFYAVNEKKKQLNGTFEPIVSVTTKKSGNKTEIIVKDNGNGIPPKVANKIFQPFFTTKLTGQGTGLGLSLSFDIIKAHGGEIRVETTEGEGATFIIVLQT